MDVAYSEIVYLKDPDMQTLKADYEQFLLSLCAPTVIDISGQQQHRTRVIVTLIHGNEPSGLIACHRFLTSLNGGSRPITNVRFIICSIEAATLRPRFSHRYLPGGEDLNRCFNQNGKAGYVQRAKLIAEAISEVTPEVVVDLHNTSGFSPAFSVSIMKNEMALSITSLFCHALILSQIRLGALMEQDFGCPTITIECGGSQDAQSHEVAYLGISKLAHWDNIQNCHQQNPVGIYLNPLRLQIKNHIPLHYADIDLGEAGVTLIDHIEQHNFGIVYAEQMLGWVDHHGLDNLTLLDANGIEQINAYFHLRGNQLLPKRPIRIFMATRQADIARNDCLFYLVNEDNHFRAC
ncbi:succinylglutamate desuccinylase/aspartoacylase family protein [Thalassotalea maritima]|uniref:succinylglutamate desuccinylase/aspartoacylase domain-containing protein n=1 Tax=Thalassotalea maritima TaxID=3242416 RepID=UPI00352903C6